jgi:hypothetical protein
LELHLRDRGGAQSDIIGIHLAGIGLVVGSLDVAHVIPREPLKKRLDHEIEEEGRQRVALKRPAVDGHWGGGAVWGEE